MTPLIIDKYAFNALFLHFFCKSFFVFVGVRRFWEKNFHGPHNNNNSQSKQEKQNNAKINNKLKWKEALSFNQLEAIAYSPDFQIAVDMIYEYKNNCENLQYQNAWLST